jgi:tetratricopeptide (TPR) repeat protein
MRRSGYTPTVQVTTDAEVCAALAQIGDVAGAMQLAHRALDSIVAMETESITPGLSQHPAIGKIVKVLTSLRDTEGLERALAIANSIENGDENYRAAAKSHFAAAWLTLGDAQKARTILNEVLAEIETLDLGTLENARAKALGVMAGELARVGLVHKATVVADSIGDHEYYAASKIAGLADVIRAMLRSGSAASAQITAGRALRTVHRLSADTAQVKSMSEIATALAEGDEKDRAVLVAREALEIARGMKSSDVMDWYKGEALSQVAKAFFTARNRAGIDAAVSAAISLERPEAATNALCTMAQWSVDVGDAEQAAGLARLALGHVEQIPDAGDDRTKKSRGLKRVSVALARSAALQEALSVAGRIPYVQDSIEAFSEVAHAANRAIETDVATTALQRALRDLEMLQQGFEYDYSIATSQIVPALHDAGYPEQSLELLDRANDRIVTIQDPNTKTTALRDLTRAAKHLGDLQRASRFAELALATAEKITEPMYASSAFQDAMDAFANASLPERAVDVFNRACAIARLGGRELVFEVLQYQSPHLAGSDGAETLWKIFETIQTVDTWWAARKIAHI